MAKQRLDKWLFFSRAVKSRTLAQKLIEAGAVRINSVRTVRTDHPVGEGDVLTMTLHESLMVWRVLAAGTRRGPAPEAQNLYQDLSPPPLPKAEAPIPFAARDAGTGRPTKKQRRDTDSLTDSD
ncbi:MAG: RNA-binding S4 domain-containing protein [Devosia sp.]